MTSPDPDLQLFIQVVDFLTNLITDLTTAIGTPLGALIIGAIVGLVDLLLTIANDVLELICG